MPLNNKNLSVLKKLASIIGVSVAAIISYEIFYWLTHVYEHDARIVAELTTLSSRIDGQIEKVYVREGDRVKSGDILFSLKSDVQRYKIQALDADLAKENGKFKKIEAEIVVFEQDLNAKLETKRETIKARKIEYATISNRYELAKQNFERSKILFEKKLVSKKHLEEEESKLLVIEAEVEKSAADIKVSELKLQEILSSKSKISVLQRHPLQHADATM